MASLRLPERLRTNLIALSAANDEAENELHQILAALSPAMLDEDFAEQISSKLTLWNKDEAKGVIVALVNLCAFRADTHLNLAQLVTDVIAALKKPPEPSVKEPQKQSLATGREDVLQRRIIRFLTLNSFSISAKAAGVLIDHQRTFMGARVLSDIRSVFQEDVSVGPDTAVIAHTLKIVFHEDGQPKTFYVVLDSNDLQKLSDVIERGRKKNDALKKLLAASNISYLEPK